MKDRILELAKLANDCGARLLLPRTGFQDYNIENQSIQFTNEQLEAFYKAAHADGQRAMRERASQIPEDANEETRIRLLEIEND